MASSVQTLFAELKKTIAEGNDELTLQICDKIIKENAADQTVLHCKAVTLIRLGRYNDALQLIARKFKGSDIDLSFEKIYCYYRTNQFQAAFELLNEIKTRSSNPGLLFLEAQLLYSQDKFTECIRVYEMLLQQTNKSDPVYEEIQVNLLAAKAGLAFTAKKAVLASEPIELSASAQYEVAYNAASLHLARSELGEARKQLEAARKACNDRLKEEDMSQEEIDEELAVIATQLAYTYQIQGRVEEAMEIYHSVLASDLKDASVNAVASNNLLAVQQQRDLGQAAQKLKTASSKEASARLKRYQKRVIAMNETLLQLYMKKYDACRDSACKLIATYPENETLYLVLAAATYQQRKAENAVEELRKYAQEKPEMLAIWFATIQVQLLQSQPAAALGTLESYLGRLNKENSERYKPAIVALEVWLYEQTGQSDRAMEILDKASQHWKMDAEFSSNTPTSIMKQTAAFKLKTGRFSEAAADYEQLVRSDPTDAQALAGLVAAYVEVDPIKAKQYGSSLPGVALDNLDIAELESMVPGVKRGYVRKPTNGDKRRKMPKEKKKRKPLLPKDYNPERTPDPERWIPARERSTYRVKGKAKKATGKGPQGTYIAGGGIGGTGSANIGGLKAATGGESPEQQRANKGKAASTTPAKTSNNNKKKKKGGKNKW
ncbi:hypothetical protein BX666DRAFT_1904325 [Dichotomocladium elegans]|nr:hypothetical protein BX666DRAFT_1904325 [Dichotomocladium elegans]